MTTQATRRFLTAFFVTTAVLLAAVSVPNAIVDPTGALGVGLFTPVVWTARKQKVARYETLSQPPSTLILGSSRVMKLPTLAVERTFGKGVFNFAVNSARAEDFLGTYDYVRATTGAPRTLLIGVDVEALAPGEPDARLIAEPELRGGVPMPQLIRSRLGALAAVTSFSNLMLTTRVLRGSATPPAATFDERGFLTYIKREAEIAEGVYDLQAEIEKSVTEYRGRFAGFNELSEERVELLRQVVARASADGVRTVLFITPLHPRVRDVLRQENDLERLTQSVWATLSELSKADGVCAFDASSIESFGGDPDLFYDGAHPREENNERLLRMIATEADCAL